MKNFRMKLEMYKEDRNRFANKHDYDMTINRRIDELTDVSGSAIIHFLSPYFSETEAGFLEQASRELIMNALKYGPGECIINVSYNIDNGEAVFTVANPYEGKLDTDFLNGNLGRTITGKDICDYVGELKSQDDDATAHLGSTLVNLITDRHDVRTINLNGKTYVEIEFAKKLQPVGVA